MKKNKYIAPYAKVQDTLMNVYLKSMSLNKDDKDVDEEDVLSKRRGTYGSYPDMDDTEDSFWSH